LNRWAEGHCVAVLHCGAAVGGGAAASKLGGQPLFPTHCKLTASLTTIRAPSPADSPENDRSQAPEPQCSVVWDPLQESLPPQEYETSLAAAASTTASSHEDSPWHSTARSCPSGPVTAAEIQALAAQTTRQRWPGGQTKAESLQSSLSSHEMVHALRPSHWQRVPEPLQRSTSAGSGDAVGSDDGGTVGRGVSGDAEGENEGAADGLEGAADGDSVGSVGVAVGAAIGAADGANDGAFDGG